MSSGLFAPVIITGLKDGGNIIISWVRCSRIPGVEQDSWSPQYWSAPLDASEETYEVDILRSNGTAIRTLYSSGATTATYTLDNQISDFGSVQSSYTMNVYQTESLAGRGSYRQASISPSSLKNVQRHFSPNGGIGFSVSMSSAFSITHGVYPVSFSLGGAPMASIPVGGSI